MKSDEGNQTSEIEFIRFWERLAAKDPAYAYVLRRTHGADHGLDVADAVSHLRSELRDACVTSVLTPAIAFLQSYWSSGYSDARRKVYALVVDPLLTSFSWYPDAHDLFERMPPVLAQEARDLGLLDDGGRAERDRRP